ncbi:tRNA (5-methylaminomethyl-2-thiouridine)(34)-methyltransferase MnmD [Rhodobacteraceae bacterium D3-12]|nr:tRNA (5-methylaminomethyl-2-thiouridine)(34)-methyltransferase MnmD [Rhodobacteraceae bacterium D3-12]
MSQQADIEWRDGLVPVSTRFDDPYFSLDNGLAETTYVFLDGNDLPARFCDGFHIGELGFGTGLNLLAALHLWRKNGQTGRLHFTSFEAFPMAGDDMIAAQAAFPMLSEISAELAPYWQAGSTAFDLPDLCFNLITGDARETLPNWPGKADAWFLDGFSPAKNPELWEPALMAMVAEHTAPSGTAATYTAAGFVRRGLTDAGFDVQRRAGFGRKRHMTIATFEGSP